MGRIKGPPGTPASVQANTGRPSELPLLVTFLVTAGDFGLKASKEDLTGGDGGIRTLDALLAHTPLAGEHLRPLGHVSVFATESGF